MKNFDNFECNQVMKRQAYRFRDMEFFNQKIMAIQEARYTFVG